MKPNKSILRAAAFLMGTLLAVTACDYDDQLHNTPHPMKGVIQVHTDYTGGTYFFRTGDYCTSLEKSPACCPDHFEPDTYTLSLYNLPEGMSDDKGTITVKPLTDGSLTPQPGDLFAATTQTQVTADDTLRLKLPMPQRTRRLTLRLTVTTGDPSRLATIKAILNGIAGQFRTSDLTLTGEPAEAKPIFTLKNGVITAPLNLLGIMPEARQTLTVTLTNRDGQSQALDYDLTELLSQFNTGTSPVTLDANLMLMEESGFGFQITGWTDGESDEQDAV